MDKEYTTQINQEAKQGQLCGQILKSLESYAVGVTYIHKTSLCGGLHAWAKEKYASNIVESSGVASNSNDLGSNKVFGPSVCEQKDQKNIYCMYDKKQLNYIHLFNTPLYIVKQERPFFDFEGLVNLKKMNGVKFEEGKSNDKACATFITYLADANFFATAEDGSHARRTGCEKELVYLKTVIRGKPVELSYGRLRE